MTASSRWPLFGVLLAAACGSSEGPPGPSFALEVDPPVGPGCIGVTGFEVIVTAAGQWVRQETLLAAAPVLSEDQCRLPSPVSVGGVDPAAALDIQVHGYDGVRHLLVSGSAHLPSLGSPGDARLQLLYAGVSGRPVLTVNRTELFGKVDLGEVEAIDVRVQPTNLALLHAAVGDGVRPFFSVGEPTAFTLDGALGASEDLVVTLTVAHGGQRTARATAVPDASGLFIDAAPR